ncbi:hypothetical protein BaRGS_00031225 [Batillaria attramentaria]|uniref:Uncharacterized protein n=1 Tax=Batillaria attramentaria TaxID=370345 RepID=A0ABD0JS79_9CAEN
MVPEHSFVTSLLAGDVQPVYTCSRRFYKVFDLTHSDKGRGFLLNAKVSLLVIRQGVPGNLFLEMGSVLTERQPPTLWEGNVLVSETRFVTEGFSNLSLNSVALKKN